VPTKRFRVRTGNPRATSRATQKKRRKLYAVETSRNSTIKGLIPCLEDAYQRNCFPVMFRPNLVAAMGFRANYVPRLSRACKSARLYLATQDGIIAWNSSLSSMIDRNMYDINTRYMQDINH